DHHGIFVVGAKQPTGCAAPSTARADLINPQGVISGQVRPCYDRLTLADLLEALRPPVSWRYYGSDADWIDAKGNGIWIAPNSIKRICNAANHKCQGAEWTSHLQFTPNQVLNDISPPTCNLAGVSWVIPDAVDSDHSWNVNIVGGGSEDLRSFSS